jgi:hypothetical protein
MAISFRGSGIRLATGFCGIVCTLADGHTTRRVALADERAVVAESATIQIDLRDSRAYVEDIEKRNLPHG